MYSASDAVVNLQQMFGDVGLIFVATIGTILVGAVALLGLGFAYAKLVQYVTGRSWAEMNDI